MLYLLWCTICFAPEGHSFRFHGSFQGILGLAAFGGGVAYLRFSVLRTIPSYVRIPELGLMKGITYPDARYFLGIPFGKLAGG